MIESMVNKEIRDNTLVAVENMAIDKAKAAGAMALLAKNTESKYEW